MKIKVAIVEDDPGLREQLMEVLRAAPDIECVGAYGSGEQALKKLPVRETNVVLMDIRLPRMSGIQCAAELKKTNPALEIIMVTVYEDSERIFKALKAGASGYLVKSSPPEQLLAAVRDASAGGAPMSSHIARRVVKHFHLLTPGSQDKEKLSPREQEVLSHLASGFIYKEISDKLGISVETVRTYVKNICLKLHVRNRSEAISHHRVDAV
jgi:DNA-binding NarL/FixJ family response regulator